MHTYGAWLWTDDAVYVKTIERHNGRWEWDGFEEGNIERSWKKDKGR